MTPTAGGVPAENARRRAGGVTVRYGRPDLRGRRDRAMYPGPRMSGHAHRRHPATLVLAAALACALVWLGVLAATNDDPISRGDHAGVAVTQQSVQHFAQRVTARPGHIRVGVTSASQGAAGGAALRATAIVLQALFGLGAVGWRVTARHRAQLHGVRAPPVLSARSRLSRRQLAAANLSIA
ncbi:hypothetical protein GCM10023322_13360 [Rugosimonospora acidiphila]|uniref:Uncharacterized protein n=1 Tax=Rugosimonospora acidiphila TaxID=556531 RepID=A0ABP9RNW4_9ACTN